MEEGKGNGIEGNVRCLEEFSFMPERRLKEKEESQE